MPVCLEADVSEGKTDIAHLNERIREVTDRRDKGITLVDHFWFVTVAPECRLESDSLLTTTRPIEDEEA